MDHASRRLAGLGTASHLGVDQGVSEASFVVAKARTRGDIYNSRVSSPVSFMSNVPFSARGRPGEIAVTVSENLDPLGVGSVPAASGFPTVCATVEYEATGYLAMLGWVQLVGEASPRGSELRYDVDPFVLFEGITTPYPIYGARPELFDAPYRSDRTLSLDWLAHSFLCVAPSSPFAKEVEAVVGFSWGFNMEAGELEIVGLNSLSRDDWSSHLDLLSTTYPAWEFTADTDW